MRNLTFWTSLLLSSVALSGTPNAANPSPGQRQTPTAEKSMHQAMTAMCEKMDSMPMAGNPEKDFLMMMIPHHQSALEMSQAYLKDGTNPKIVALATKIIEAQKKEIAEMNAILKDLGALTRPASN